MKTLAKIFFGVDSFEQMKKKGFSMALIVPAIRWGEWALMGITATIVAFLKHNGLGDVTIFFLLWFGNLAIYYAMVVFNDNTDVDITLMEGMRRLVDASFQKSWIGGIFIEVIVLIRLIIWDGAAYFIIFFRSRIKAKSIKILAFIAASGFQMAAWTALYIKGFEGFSQLLKTIIYGSLK